MKKIKSIICLITALLMISVSLCGCNTIEGAGEDIERGGEEIQEAAD